MCSSWSGHRRGAGHPRRSAISAYADPGVEGRGGHQGLRLDSEDPRARCRRYRAELRIQAAIGGERAARTEGESGVLPISEWVTASATVVYSSEPVLWWVTRQSLEYRDMFRLT